MRYTLQTEVGERSEISERLVRKDLDPGSITVTNLGSLYREWNGKCTLLEIIPPQLCAIALNSIREGVLPLTIAFDHRALDADDIFPFMRRMDELLSSTDTLRSFLLLRCLKCAHRIKY